MQHFFVVCFLLAVSLGMHAQNTSNHGNKFEQLGNLLPTPNEYRTASGAPGPKYWQQRADYTINCTLDEKNLLLTGAETIVYYNNSPNTLTYLWLQLDENEHSTKNNAGYSDPSRMPRSLNTNEVESYKNSFTPSKEDKFGCKIDNITDAQGRKLIYTINKTMMRIECPLVLKPGDKMTFKINWHYYIADRMAIGGRGGYEFFKGDGNHLFTMTQWYPRLCVYSDFQGWQNHQFTGRGEFALTFGNFNVTMTVPGDHVVMATGECQNYKNVLSTKEMARWQQAQTSKEVVEIVTLDEAKAKEPKKVSGTKTWNFRAFNVRDFAWGSSRKFIWDAMPQYIEGKKVMCMSAYPKEAYALYRKYSTKAVAHTIKTYSKFTIPYPYPVAQSIEAANGMEYPMICFNFGRTEKDGTYSQGTKYGMLGVVIHEVGHNFFPMIINSDERQWSWMDEGLNTFVEYLTEELYENDFPSRRGPAHTIVDYMKSPKEQLEPIMVNSENIVNFGANAYSKPATALNILRESIMGRELFDYAFKEYARRWAFKHPEPADFFRTMEDASAEDLDWFWRGWFFGIEPVDIAIDTVKTAMLDKNGTMKYRSTDEIIKMNTIPTSNRTPVPFDDISKIRNRQDPNIKFAVDADKSLVDYYTKNKSWNDSVNTLIDREQYIESQIKAYIPDTLSANDKQLLPDLYFYEVSFTNKGGLVMPVIVEFTFKDGTKETERLSVQIWRKNENKVTRLFVKNKEVMSIKLDPMRETADINEQNNVWPNNTAVLTPLQIFKEKQNGPVRGGSNGLNNPMQNEAKRKNENLKTIY
jgi:hypothetical protein